MVGAEQAVTAGGDPLFDGDGLTGTPRRPGTLRPEPINLAEYRTAENKSSADSRTSTRSPPDGPAPLREEAGHRHDRVFEPNRLGSGHRLLPIHVMAGDQGGRCLRALQDDAAQWLWLHTPIARSRIRHVRG